MPRKPYTRSVNTLNPAKHQRIINWIKTNLINSIIITLVLVALILYISILTNSRSEKQDTPESSPKVIAQQTTNLEVLLEKQNNVIRKLEENNLVLENNIKVLDKRIQSNTEIIKRMCEYIWVITIDKKIAPRQCYPDYNWRREEVNGN